MGQDSNYIYGSATAFGSYSEGSQTNAGLDRLGGQKTSRHLPSFYELSQAGRIYTAQFGVVTNAVASVTDIPTTGAHFALWNGESAGRGARSYYILGFGVASASGTVGIGAFVVGGVSGAQSTVTTTSGNIIKNCSGPLADPRTSLAAADSTLTLTTQPAWAILGNVNTVSGIAIGYGATNYGMAGLFRVPPTCCFALAVVSPTGSTPAFLASITWAEVETYGAGAA